MIESQVYCSLRPSLTLSVTMPNYGHGCSK